MSQAPEAHSSAAVLQLASGRWISHFIGVAAELGLADLVQTGPTSAEEIARRSGLHAPSVYRLMRALSTLGIFAEDQDRRFAQTPLSDAMRSDVPHSVRGMCRVANRPWSIRAWTELEHSLTTGDSGFQRAHGKSLFDYLDANPHELGLFAEAMGGMTSQIAHAVDDVYDFSNVRVLADIGGSRGMLLGMLLARQPHLRGVLFDLPKVTQGARAYLEQHGVADRVEIVGGSFFEQVPGNADAYLLKHVLHDFNDTDCARILSAVHRGAPAGARLLLVESILSGPNEPQLAKLLDLEMLVLTPGGRERTLPEWKQLLSSTGFEFVRALPTPALGAFVIEAVRR